MQKVSMIQTGFYSAILIAAAANIRVRRTHDKELMEIPLGQKLKQHTGRLLLDNHAKEADHVRMLKLSQHGSLLQQKPDK